MNDQIDQLLKMKAKIDKDKQLILRETDDVRAANDEVSRSKASAEKQVKSLQGSLTEICKKIDEATLMLGDY